MNGSVGLARALGHVRNAVVAFVAILAWTASYLFGVYGPIGKGGAVIYLFVLALALPYLVAVPALRLVWVGPRERA